MLVKLFPLGDVDFVHFNLLVCILQLFFDDVPIDFWQLLYLVMIPHV